MESLATDAFTNSDSTTLETHGNWLPHGTGSFIINTNSASSDSTAEAGMYYTGITVWHPDQYAEATIAAMSDAGSGQIGVACRMAQSSTNTQYWFVVRGDFGAENRYLEEVTAGSSTTIDSDASFGVVGDVLRIDAVGTTIRGLVDGVEVLSSTDSTIATGGGGIASFNNSGTTKRIDDFEAGNIGPTFDATASGSAKETSTLAFNHTCTGTNRVLVVGVGSTGTISSATYDGVSMTAVAAQAGTVRQFYLVAPATGSNSVSVTMSGGDFHVGGAVSYTNAAQTSPVDVSDNASNNSVALTTTVDSTAVVDVTYFNGEGSASTVGSGQTQRWSLAIESHPGQGSTEPKSGSGSITMDWTGGSSSDIHAVAIKPYTPPVGDMVATTPVTFSETVALTGLGDLATAPSIVFSETVALTGLSSGGSDVNFRGTSRGVMRGNLRGIG